MDIEIRAIEPRYYVGIRRTVKHDELGPACEEILPRTAKWLAQKGVAIEGEPIAVYHSVNRETGDFDVQPGFFVVGSVDSEGDFSCAQTAGGEALVAMHEGPYARLGETWSALFARAEELGRNVSKSSWEVYVDDPRRTAEIVLRTQIFVPIDPAG